MSSESRTDDVEALSIGTDAGYPCGNPGWPAELAGGDNRVKLQDVTSFTVPAPRKFNTSPGMTGFDSRWDLVPGRRRGCIGSLSRTSLR